ncbi:MAG: GNAT family N-acetyltransferase [Firmicutes bacterium]|nr:GNAT family N-acetyltransferase [Bacillota bacterium]
MSCCQTSWTIRPSQENDLALVCQIFLQGFPQSVLHYVGESSTGIEQALRDMFSALLEYQPQGFLVAEHQGRIGGYTIAVPHMPELWWFVLYHGHVWHWAKRWLRGEYGIGLVPVLGLARNKLGFALSQIQLSRKTPKTKGHTAQILSIAVHPLCRGQGIGRALLEKAIAHLATTPATYVKLEVRPDNTPARRLYESLGFQAISKTRDSQGEWIVMLKELLQGPAD